MHIGGPRVIRIDRGVKNGLIAEAQIALRMNHSDNLAGAGSIRYDGSSPTNSVCIHYLKYIDM